jgi:hypothetical protein
VINETGYLVSKNYTITYTQEHSVFTEENINSIPAIEEHPVGSKLTSFDLQEEVLKRLIAVNPNKSCGPDGFHPRLLKELATVLAGPLTSFFRKTLNEGSCRRTGKKLK